MRGGVRSDQNYCAIKPSDHGRKANNFCCGFCSNPSAILKLVFGCRWYAYFSQARFFMFCCHLLTLRWISVRCMSILTSSNKLRDLLRTVRPKKRWYKWKNLNSIRWLRILFRASSVQLLLILVWNLLLLLMPWKIRLLYVWLLSYPLSFWVLLYRCFCLLPPLILLVFFLYQVFYNSRHFLSGPSNFSSSWDTGYCTLLFCFSDRCFSANHISVFCFDWLFSIRFRRSRSTVANWQTSTLCCTSKNCYRYRRVAYNYGQNRWVEIYFMVPERSIIEVGLSMPTFITQLE